MIDLPGDVEATDRIFPTKSLESGGKPGGGALATQPFSAFMKPDTASALAASGKSTMISPFDMMQGTTPLASTPSYDALQTQAKSVQSTLGDINNQLNTPGLKLKASSKYLLKNKLSDANDHMRRANAQIGAETVDKVDSSQFTGPMAKFLHYLANGQVKMESAKQQLQSLKDKGEAISPGDFLLVQVNMNQAQQQLEFASVLLSTAVSDIKQMGQMQL